MKKQAILTELINLEAILNLPKGTELYLSDIHGEFAAFDYILRSCAGNLKLKITECFKEQLNDSEINQLTLLIAYPEEAIQYPRHYPFYNKDYQERVIRQLITLLGFVSTKYTRSKVRKKFPEEYAYILEEFIYTDLQYSDQADYFKNMIHYLIELDEALPFILKVASVIQNLIIDHIHIVGDIFDRGKEADLVMERICHLPSVDIQWGNHDLLWMGAYAGNAACLCHLLRIATRYQYLYDIEKAYGINLRPLFLFAEKTYHTNPAFTPKGKLDADQLILEQVHQALSIMQFKLEGQIATRRPELKMDMYDVLSKIDYENNTIDIDGQTYKIENPCFQTVNPKQPLQLTEAEQAVLESLMYSFQHSLKMKKHMEFLMKHGSMYLIYNQHLLYHGCIPLAQSGELINFTVGNDSYQGAALLDFFEKHLKESFRNLDTHEDFATDLSWYAWCGPFSPLFGKHKMTTFERYFIKDKKTHLERKNAYYQYRDSEKICQLILKAFGLNPEFSRIINGHTPVKTTKGESPIRGDGHLFVIDGGLSKAYQKQTGIAGYSLLNNSYGFQIVTHQPFISIDYLFQQQTDMAAIKRVVDKVAKRTLIKDTTIGREIQVKKQKLQSQLQ
ncbi:fructose-bisphosphatase class III [Enterococcus cecorum]|uniref:fructose-bisphosphatase class III n=1 Tax=Enterococcus cecorum TaxID=44008 RepID=UPI000641387C|nr:fructose-bisphosphatase class III [Enterococcus cecorum]KLN91798.1 fructose 1,6-bisphosphatase [Enterococcus cecorum]KLN92250.1 fructose 1,6-bisphosphatase [Enterococcus cecorum]CAI3271913.1 fructose-bisphosphatase class III [Enterococcus cecorum]CAI3276479.1 fructose-bisphosphatase class III [Enterococcus cecorum]CAI3279450.1 fructose-bisphosphatase class III [Enterococcus cecorum]